MCPHSRDGNKLLPVERRWDFFLLVIMHEKNWSVAKALVPRVLREYTVARPYYCSALLSNFNWKNQKLHSLKETEWIWSHLVALCTTRCPLIAIWESVTWSYTQWLKTHLPSIHLIMLTEVYAVCGIFLFFLDTKWLTSCFWSDCTTSGDVWLICESAPTLLMSSFRRILDSVYFNYFSLLTCIELLCIW